LDKIWGPMDHEFQMLPLVHPFWEEFHDRSYCLRCGFTVCRLCFPSFRCSFPEQSPDIFSGPVYCCFAYWIPGFLP
jgi:hypothetical protein